MLVFLISRYIAWLYGVTTPIGEWEIAPFLQCLSWCETVAEVFVAGYIAYFFVEDIVSRQF